MPFFVTYQLQAPDLVRVLLFLMLLVNGLFVFFWKGVADRWSKGRAYAAGLVIVALTVGSSFFVPTGAARLGFPLFILAGLGLAAHWVLPWARIPDVLEFDQAVTGERREGMYYGVYGLIDKISRTVGIAAVGWLLDAFGYVPNVEQTARSLLGIRLLFGPSSAVLLLMVVPFLFFYPITRATHAEIRRRLAASAAIGNPHPVGPDRDH